MKVHIHTDIDKLFGRALRLWRDVLPKAGHDVRAMVQASQKLLQGRFSPAAWGKRMLTMPESVA